MTSSLEIKSWMYGKKSFFGVFKATKLSSIKQIFKIKNVSMIVNIKERKISGHFIALYLSDSFCLYFDSLGKKKINYYVRNFLKEKYNFVIMNKLRLQSSKSSYCAHFCSLFCKKVTSLKTYQSFLQSFNHSNLLSNDLIIDLIFNKSLP